jgi:hypothetical protein
MKIVWTYFSVRDQGDRCSGWGDLLPEDRYEAWAEYRREGLRQLYLAVASRGRGTHTRRGARGPDTPLCPLR